MNILQYFDLNQHAHLRKVASSSSTGIFAPPKAKPAELPVWKQLILYAGVALGVLFSTALKQFQASGVASLNITPTLVLLSLFIALVIMPAVYKQTMKVEGPFLIQLGLCVQQGVFWSVLFTAIANKVAG